MTNYNPWYTYTYDAIVNLPMWKNVATDVELKILMVFGWMPQTIMNIKHKGGTKKAYIYDLNKVVGALTNVAQQFKNLQMAKSLTGSLDLAKYQSDVLDICKAIFPLLGSVAASKFMHFSVPQFLPMWDRKLRKKFKCTDCPLGYFDYMKKFQNKLNDQAIIAEISKANMHRNMIRSLDIYLMKCR